VTRYLIDTNVVSELRKPKPHGGVLAWIRNIEFAQVFLSAATIGELQIGIEMTRRQDASKASEIEDWLNTLAAQMQVLPMDGACFREWARLTQRKPSQLAIDAMLAATARVNGLVLATRNESDFRHFDVEVFNPFTYPR
jgi:hypothetical protein